MNIGYFFAVVRASFYSKNFYRTVGQYWKGYGWGYLLGAIALSWAIVITVWMAKISAVDIANTSSEELTISEPSEDSKALTINELMRGIIAQVPEITLEKGELSIEEAEPFTIYVPGTEKPFAIIDTTGKADSLKETNAFILITEDEIMILSSDSEGSRYQVSEIWGDDSMIIDHAQIINWIQHFKSFMLWFLPLVISPFLVGLSFVYSLIRCLFYAGIGFLFSRIQAIYLPFPVIMRLAIVSAIPVTLISALPMVFPVLALIPYSRLIFFIIGIGYLLFAIHVNQDNKEEQKVDVERHEI